MAVGLDTRATPRAWPALPAGVLWGIGSLTAYALASLIVYPLIGGAALALMIIPVLITGWFTGMRPGIVVGAVILPITPLVFALAGAPYTEELFTIGYALVVVVMIATGVTVGRLHDVGARLAEQARALQASEARFRDLFDFAPVGYHELDLEGCITRVNRTELTMLGYAEDEMLGRPIYEFIVDTDVETWRSSFQARVDGTAPKRPFERTYRRKDGSTIPLLLDDRRILGADGSILGLRTTLQDNTQQKDAEAKLREADRLKTEFVSLVSHELRTPLTSIKGYVDLLMGGEAGELAPDQQEFLQIVQNNSNRLAALINDLLDISRIEAGKVELDRETLDLTALIRSVVLTLRPQIDAKDQTLTLDLPDDLPAIFADAQRVTQILNNLLSNAHKYTPAGGAIGIEVRADDVAVHVSVSDSGIGLTLEEQANLFTKFFRAKNRTTQEVGGTGLGLAITKSLVELHGGQIAVESAPDQGSTFGFALPLAAGQATDRAATTTEDGPIAPGQGARVLIVEDDPDIAHLIARYLEHGGYRAVTAPDGATAMKIARSQPLDLITLDVMLPDADGLTVLEWLKADATTAAIPVLLLSMVPDDGRGRRLGAIDYLAKPIAEEDLLRRVGTILRDRAALRILIADDDDDVRGLLVGCLRRAGHWVVGARDGEEAVALAASERPDLALLDVRMPRMDGVAALRALRSTTFGRTLPVVMMTASAGVMAGSRGAIAALGAELMDKPCTAEEIAAAIARALSMEVAPPGKRIVVADRELVATAAADRAA
jgi:PAS domain S-box-containing protein